MNQIINRIKLIQINQINNETVCNTASGHLVKLRKNFAFLLCEFTGINQLLFPLKSSENLW